VKWTTTLHFKILLNTAAFLSFSLSHSSLGDFVRGKRETKRKKEKKEPERRCKQAAGGRIE